MDSLEEQLLPRSFDSVFYGAAGGVDTPSDGEFNRVSFLSHFDGANNGVNNAFDDGSTNNYTVTTNGNSTQGGFGPFARPDGEWGALFDGASTRPYITTPYSSDFNFGTGSFTVEAFIFPRLLTIPQGIYCTSQGSDNVPKFIVYLLEDTLKAHFNGLGSGSVFYDATVDIVPNAWTHIAFVRNGSTWSWYINGVQRGTGSDSTNVTFTNQATVVGYGGETYFSASNLIISNLRVVKGTAVYTGNFTAPTEPLTAITNTKLLTCQSDAFVDNSASAHVFTAVGSPKVTAFGSILTSKAYDPAVNGASAYFDGGGDYLALPSNSLNLGNSNFTIETWVYTSSTAQQLIVGSCVGSNGYGSYMFNINYNSDKVRFFCRYAGGNVLSYTVESGSFPINSWKHLAATRDGANLRVFINGTQAGSTNTTLSTSAIDAPRGGQNTQGTTDVYYVGKTTDGSLPIIGSLCDLRVIVGTAVYTSNFTSPTAPLTAVTNTKLLLNMADGKAFDSAAQNDMVLSGNANTSTDQAKFGDTSLHLDGSGDFAYLTDPSVGHFIAGNFTAECWVYPTASPSQPIIMGQWSGSNSWAIQMSNNSSRYLRFLTSATGDTVSSTAVALNQWSHVALVRNGSAFAIYLNGTSVATASSSNALLASGNALSIGANLSGGQPYTGYIDEVRISKMARYTSNFTAPDESFADKGK